MTGYPDRLRLPIAFDPARLAADLHTIESSLWIDHFVPGNYDGSWSAVPLRAVAGPRQRHPILMLVSDPGATRFDDTSFLDACPYYREVLDALGCPLGVVRLMKLEPGSHIKTHSDHDLSFEQGWVRLHVPVATNPDVDFVLNGERVSMVEGECWYLRLSDPHSVSNRGDTARVHIVIDAPVGPELRALFEQALEADATLSG